MVGPGKALLGWTIEFDTSPPKPFGTRQVVKRMVQFDLQIDSERE
jgi:hypothetical protein